MSTPDVFLSYSREDQPAARRFAEALQRAGFSVWWDQSLSAGETFDEVTEKALANARAVVVLWSPRSVVSRWVRAEATQADDNGTLVPVLIEPCNLPIKFKLTQAAPLSHWRGNEDDPAWRAFVADLRRFTAAGTQAPGTAHAPVAMASPGGPPRRARAWIAAGAVGLLALASGIAWFVLRDSDASTVTSAAAQGPVTIAVLPFKDMSAAKDQEYLADGLAEEILNSLAGIGGNLQVTGRASSFYFKGRDEDQRNIGEKLGVAYLLEGSVRKQEEQLRITAQLVKAADGFQLWSRTYDRPAQDVFRIQEEIARAVADRLQIALGVGDFALIPGMTRDVAAYEAWLEGRNYMYTLTLDDSRTATDRFDLAMQRDPGFFWAWVDAWNAHFTLAALAGSDPTLSATSRARAAEIRSGIASQFPDLPVAQEFLEGTEGIASGDWMSQAIRSTEGAMPPVDLRLERILGSRVFPDISRVRLDKASEAIAGLERARIHDPLNPSVLVYLPEAYANAGRIREAMEEQDRGWQIAPSELLAANALITAMGAGDAASIRQRWEWLNDPQAGPLPRALYPLRDHPAQLRAEVRRVAAAREPVAASQLALWAAAFGDPELALQVLQEDADLQRRVISVLAFWRPVMRDVRRLPGFKQLVRDWGLVDYWKQHGWGDHCRPLPGDDFECS